MGIPDQPGRGWVEVFRDNFNERSFAHDRSWSPYRGQPGGDPGGWWDPSHVAIAGGVLRLEGYRDPRHAPPGAPGRYVTGGVSSQAAVRLRFGKFLVRFRIDRGQGIAPVALLWPTSGRWPPEIDFAEDNGAGPRSFVAGTLHYGSVRQDLQIGHRASVNLAAWHTLGVEWTPGRLTYTLDGQAWQSISSPHVPVVPMTLDLQTQAWDCGEPWERCPNATTPRRVDMDVDWVVAYKRAPSANSR